MTSFLPLANSYLQIKNKFYLSPHRQFYVYDLPVEHINEKHLHYLWAERLIKPYKNLQTLDGRSVVINSPGLWNTEDGPDFKQASLKIGSELVSGDVEIHLYSSDWYRHKHHQDARYNKVILHITGWQDNRQKYVATADNKKVPQLILGNIIEPELEEIDELLESGKYNRISAHFGGTGRCSQFCLNPAFHSSLQQFLEMAAEARLNYKIERIKNMLTIPDYDALLYEFTMEALGYRYNRGAFRELARRVPLNIINKIPSAPPLGGVNAPAFQSLFIYQGNLVPSAGENVNEESKRYLLKIAGIYEKLSKTYHLNKPAKLLWKIKGTRPLNYPTRRLAGMSYYLANNIGLFSALKNYYLDEYQRPSKPNLASKLLLSFNPADKTEYWLTHTTFTSSPLTKPAALIGKEVISNLEINTFIPLLLLNTSETNDRQFGKWLIERWKHYPLLSDNSITRFMKYRLFADKTKAGKRFIKTAGDQQALIQIYRDFCAKGFEGCNTCGLLKWFKQV